eukprot:Seg2614.3 transcript_id=Seg2614.3/GoldUCD/mRNA.D3Y31 product="Sulfoacetaldehyde acetyltransferase" protein_id=Seg2614.3/GoldUCD/D3Y31
MLQASTRRGASSLLKFARPALCNNTPTRACVAASAPTPPDPLPEPVPQNVPIKMTASEAFVETLLAQGVTDVFGIVGSAFMDGLDLFPEAGIRFLSVQHEQNAAHMADGYARACGKHGVCIAQNGPGKKQ